MTAPNAAPAPAPAGAPAPAPVPGSPEYDTAMAAKADKAAADALAAAGTTPPAAPEPAKRPEHIPEKFWDAATGTVRIEEMAKSYAALEAKQSAPAKPPAPAQGADGKPAEGTPPAAGKLDMGAFSAEYQKDGKLSDDSYAKLAAAGYERGIVDQFIAGQVAMAQLTTQQVHAAAGGEEAYGKMVEWASTGMTPAEIAAYDAAMDGTPEQRLLAVNGLKARYEAAMGRDPKLLGGGNPNTGGAQPFRSSAEVTAAMRDSRYRTDPAFRAELERRLSVTPDSVMNVRV